MFIIGGFSPKKSDTVIFSLFDSLNCNSELVLLCFTYCATSFYVIEEGRKIRVYNT